MATKPTVAPEKDEKPPVNPDATAKPAEGEVPDAELAGLAENVKATLFGEKKRPVPEKKAEPEKKPEAAAKPTEEAVATADAGKTPDAKPTPAKPAKKPKTAREETDETIGKTARATAEAVARELRQPADADEPVEVPEGELSPEDQSDLNGFKKLEQLNPQRKGIAERFVQFVEAREEYEANWLKENPGKEFDPDADEHNDFFKKYAEFDSPHTAAELEDAKIELKLDKRFEERLKPMEEQRRVEQVKRQVQPMIAREVVSRVKSLADKVSPELSKQLVDDKGNFRFTDETMKKLSEDFPVEYAALEELVTGKKDHSGKIIPQTSLIELLSVLEQMPYSQHTGFRLNPQDPVHGRVIDYMRDYEQHMETAPADVKIPDVHR